MQDIAIKPLLTEKTLTLAGRGWYTFAVSGFARKKHIAAYIAKLFKVKVVKVRTSNVHGKVKRSGKKMLKRILPDWKKALVQLEKGQTIEAFSVQGESSTVTK